MNHSAMKGCHPERGAGGLCDSTGILASPLMNISKRFCYVCKSHVVGTDQDFKLAGHSDEKVKELPKSPQLRRLMTKV